MTGVEMVAFRASIDELVEARIFRGSSDKQFSLVDFELSCNASLKRFDLAMNFALFEYDESEKILPKSSTRIRDAAWPIGTLQCAISTHCG
jgi:hypothetical protein